MDADKPLGRTITGYATTGLALLLAFLPREATAAAAPATGTVGDREAASIAPYFWLPDIGGSVRFAGVAVPVSLARSELLGGAHNGAMAYARWQRGGRFAYAEGIYMHFADHRFAPFFDQSLNSTVRFGELGGGLQRALARDGRPWLAVWAYGGLRLTRIDAAVSGAALTTASSDTWVDPVVGLVLARPLSRRLALQFKLDGAGVGFSHNDYVSAQGLLEWRLRPRWSLAAGYRWSSAVYRSTDGLNFSLEGRGPVLALRYVAPAAP
ncbi:MAG: hypothetical protein U1F11_04710 [Steroidobacteraceae bacterium]